MDGIPLPDFTGFQQATLADIKPGARVPHRTIDTIPFEGETPVLATAGTGALLGPESIRVLLSARASPEDDSLELRSGASAASLVNAAAGLSFKWIVTTHFGFLKNGIAG